MWGWESLSTLAEKATTSLTSAKDNLSNLSEKANALSKDLVNKTSDFIAEQKKEYQKLDETTELQERLKKQREYALKHGYPPWFIFNVSNSNSNSNSNLNNNKMIKDMEQLRDELRLRILKICEDPSNFLVQAPSSASVFDFDIKSALIYANAALQQDPILPKIRFELVPKKVQEEQFWMNYFYRVQLIRESMGIAKLDLSKNAEIPIDIVIPSKKSNSQLSNETTNNNSKKKIIHDKPSFEDSTMVVRKTQLSDNINMRIPSQSLIKPNIGETSNQNNNNTNINTNEESKTNSQNINEIQTENQTQNEVTRQRTGSGSIESSNGTNDTSNGTSTSFVNIAPVNSDIQSITSDITNNELNKNELQSNEIMNDTTIEEEENDESSDDLDTFVQSQMNKNLNNNNKNDNSNSNENSTDEMDGLDGLLDGVEIDENELNDEEIEKLVN